MFVSSKTMRGTEHMNFHGHDSQLGPALVSIKDVVTEDGITMTHMILRLSVGTFQQYLEAEEDLDPESILAYAKRLCPNLTIDCFMPIISRRASNVIEEFDQKTSLNAKQYKFGVLYQKEGQFNEEDIFQNQNVQYLGKMIPKSTMCGLIYNLHIEWSQKINDKKECCVTV